MPTYEYLCETCSHRFEAWQKMSDQPLQSCPECGHHIRRVFYPAGIVFKGSGFYKTDHGNGSIPEGKKSEVTAGSQSNGNKPTEGGKISESSGTGGSTGASASAKNTQVPVGASV
jgi:putative FmdB family regulatory protein